MDTMSSVRRDLPVTCPSHVRARLSNPCVVPTVHGQASLFQKALQLVPTRLPSSSHQWAAIRLWQRYGS